MAARPAILLCKRAWVMRVREGINSSRHSADLARYGLG
jgi:hypothetical protein